MNILTIPSSGSIIFDNNSAGSRYQSSSTEGAILSFDGEGGLKVTSLISGFNERFSVEGINGTLFSVTEISTGLLYSVNDISGRPFFQVYDTGVIISGHLVFYGERMDSVSDIYINNNRVITENQTGILANKFELFESGLQLSSWIFQVSGQTPLVLNVVYTTGDQNISGNKVFLNNVSIGSNTNFGNNVLINGSSNTNYADNAHVEGSSNYNTGFATHVEGVFNSGIGDYSHAEGVFNIARGDYSHAEGINNITDAAYSHAEGNGNRTEGGYSHAEGINTRAVGLYSHSEGGFTIASGTYSSTKGLGTIALGLAQFTVGKYNITNENSLVIIGNGGSDNERSNIIEVEQNALNVYGQIKISGNELVTGLSFTGSDAIVGKINFLRTGSLIHIIKDGNNIYFSGEPTGQFVSNSQLLDVSGVLEDLISASSAGVAAINGASGSLTINGAGSVSVLTNGQTITISGATGFLSDYLFRHETGIFIKASDIANNYATVANLNSTGLVLSDRILQSSGSILSTVSSTYSTISNLYDTGLLLNNRILQSSGANLSTVASTYATIANLSATGNNLQNQLYTLSGISVLDGETGILLNRQETGVFIKASDIASIYATILNLYNTGNNLQTQINILSGISALDSETGILANKFDLFLTGQNLYPRNNPSGYISSLGGSVTIEGGGTILNGQLLVGAAGINAFEQGNLYGVSGIGIISGSGQIGIGINQNLFVLAGATGILLNRQETGIFIKAIDIANLYATITNLYATGNNLQTQLYTLSGISVLDSETGILLNRQETGIFIKASDVALSYATIPNLYSTGSNLQNQLYILSGIVTLDSETGILLNRQETGIFIKASDIANQYATIANLYSTGSVLQNRILTLSGISVLDSETGILLNRQETGIFIKASEIASTYATIANLYATGINLQQQLYILSGLIGGEINTASNLGNGSGIFAQKSVVDLQFKSVKAGNGIGITGSPTELSIYLPNNYVSTDATGSFLQTGIETVWIPSASMSIRTSGSPSIISYQTDGSFTMIEGLMFDRGTTQYAQFNIAFPKSWDGNYLRVLPYWAPATGTTGTNITWGIQSKSVNNLESLTGNFGAVQYSTGIGNSNYTLYSGQMTNNIVPAGTINQNSVLYFQVFRDSTANGIAGNNNLEHSGILIGLKLFYGTNKPSDI